MKIRTKIALQFSLIVAGILFFFSLSIYYLSENYRQQEFYNSLRDRAITTSRLLIKEKEIDKQLLKIIDKNTLSTLYAVQVLVFNDSNQVAYSNYEADTIYYSPDLLERIRSSKYIETEFGNKQVVGTMYRDTRDSVAKNYVILARSSDTYGAQKLENIKDTMIIGFISSVLLAIILGFVFAGQSLKPISELNNEISKVTIQNLKQKLKTRESKDEIAALASNFNQMLDRLEKSFELQKSFVSNASHELRTPLAALKSEIQIALQKERESGDYQNVLKTLALDTQRLINLTNGMLILAKYENSEIKSQFLDVRIDSILFKVQEDLQHQHPDYNINVDFSAIPEEDTFLELKGNEQLLQTLFSNLIDNACKYSDPRAAEILIDAQSKVCKIDIIDQGIGIPESERDLIFEPFHRSKNSSNAKGHGIGLSICRKIVEAHGGKLTFQSTLGVGSTFTVELPR